MSNPALFSILIANYNNGSFFKDCYKSIIAQTYQNWEAIIVDDCSSDNSIEEIKKIVGEDSRFRIYKNESNSGVGFTKKRSIELANGEICGFVDPDDAITENALEIMIKEHSENSDVSLTYSNLVYCDENLQQTSIKKTHQVENHLVDFFNLYGSISHFAAFKKSFYLQTVGLNSFLKRAIDQDLYLKLYDAGKVKYVDQDFYLYRLHSGGISTMQNTDKAYFWHWQVIFDRAEHRNINVENLFLENFVRKNAYNEEIQKNSKKIEIIKNSRWLKLGYKLGLFKVYKNL